MPCRPEIACLADWKLRPRPVFVPTKCWAARCPTSPQPMIKTRSFRKREGKAPKGVWFEGKIRDSQISDPLGYRKDELSNQRSTQRPYFQRRQFRNLAGGRHPSGHWTALRLQDGACGSCKCKKISGTVVHGEHQAKALSAEEEAQGLILTCCFNCPK
jgi:hypothetical protein